MEIIYKNVRHWYARISSDGELKITIPTSLKNNKAFQSDLISKAKKLQIRHNKREKYFTKDSEHIVLFGEKIKLEEYQSQISFSGKRTEKKQIDSLKKILYEYTKELLDEYASKIWKKYFELKIRKLKAKRWSCSYDQKIVLNMDLVHLPNKYIQYVIIHEACHLKQKNHSKKFRDLVAIYCPEYKILRKELRNLLMT